MLGGCEWAGVVFICCCVDEDETFLLLARSEGKRSLDLETSKMVDSGEEEAHTEGLAETPFRVLTTVGEDVFEEPDGEAGEFEADGCEGVKPLDGLVLDDIYHFFETSELKPGGMGTPRWRAELSL